MFSALGPKNQEAIASCAELSTGVAFTVPMAPFPAVAVPSAVVEDIVRELDRKRVVDSGLNGTKPSILNKILLASISQSTWD